MLHLINQSKVGRNINSIEGNVNWKALFKVSEDSLTSSVFGLLFYLPVELFWKIITEACYDDKLPKQCGKLLGYEFWPHWDSENTANSSFIEPDILIKFEEFNFIVEAKRYDYNQQYTSQWKNEIQSYFNEFKEGKPMFFLAIGGIGSGDESATKMLNDTWVVKCRWSRLLNQIKEIYNQMLKINYLINSNDSVINVLNDLILAFGIHGFSTGELLETLPTNLLINYKCNSI